MIPIELVGERRTDLILRQIERLRRDHLSEGRLARTFAYQIDEADFGSNVRSVVVLYDLYKIPRIIKRLKSTK